MNTMDLFIETKCPLQGYKVQGRIAREFADGTEQCLICNGKFPSYGSFMRHVGQNHIKHVFRYGQKGIICTLCSLYSKSMIDILKHLESHLPQARFTLDDNHDMSINQMDPKKFRVLAHGEKRVKCLECGRKYKSHSAYLCHKFQIHDSQKMETLFQLYDPINNLCRWVEENLLICMLCGQKFRDLLLLEYHIYETYFEEYVKERTTGYICTICNTFTVEGLDMLKHLESHRIDPWWHAAQMEAFQLEIESSKSAAMASTMKKSGENELSILEQMVILYDNMHCVHEPNVIKEKKILRNRIDNVPYSPMYRLLENGTKKVQCLYCNVILPSFISFKNHVSTNHEQILKIKFSLLNDININRDLAFFDNIAKQRRTHEYL